MSAGGLVGTRAWRVAASQRLQLLDQMLRMPTCLLSAAVRGVWTSVAYRTPTQSEHLVRVAEPIENDGAHGAATVDQRRGALITAPRRFQLVFVRMSWNKCAAVTAGSIWRNAADLMK